MTELAQQERESSALSVRETSGAAIVKAVPIPAQLQDLGVRIAEDEGGLRVIVLPPAVREAVNLITPVSSWNQADPNWTPTINLVQLDKDSHTYALPGGKLGLNKQALETLGRCAGVLYTHPTRVPKAELQDDEAWAYRATAGFRRSDGTVDEVTRERGFNREAEQMEIEDSVRSAKYDGNLKFTTPEAIEAECRKRWIAELRFGPAKTESKAINRALRAGLGIPASVTAAQIQKPWLVVGFNFTPDYNDPETRRALMQLANIGSNRLYGTPIVSDEMPERPGADIPVEASFGELPSGTTPYVTKDSPAQTPSANEEGAAGTSVLTDNAASSPGEGQPAASSPLPEPDDEALLEADEASRYIPESGKYGSDPEKLTYVDAETGEKRPLSLGEIYALGEEGKQYLQMCCRSLSQGLWRTQVEAFCRVAMPAEYQAALARRAEKQAA